MLHLRKTSSLQAECWTFGNGLVAWPNRSGRKLARPGQNWQAHTRSVQTMDGSWWISPTGRLLLGWSPSLQSCRGSRPELGLVSSVVLSPTLNLSLCTDRTATFSASLSQAVMILFVLHGRLGHLSRVCRIAAPCADILSHNAFQLLYSQLHYTHTDTPSNSLVCHCQGVCVCVWGCQCVLINENI